MINKEPPFVSLRFVHKLLIALAIYFFEISPPGWMRFASASIEQSQKVISYSVPDAKVPASFDSLAAGNFFNTMLVTAIFDTLYEYKYLKRPYELKPGLAASLPIISNDRLTYTIPLKKGVFFSNDPAFPDGKGREVVAEDFVYSIKRHFDPKNYSSGRWAWQNLVIGLDEWSRSGADYQKTIDGLQAIDKYTIQIKLKKPYPNLIYTMAMTFSAVVAKEVVDHYGSAIHHHPVGSGAWVLESFSDTVITLAKNPNYRKEIFDPISEGYDAAIHEFTGIKSLAGQSLPIVDKIRLRYMQNGIERWEALLKNEIHYTLVPSSLWNELLSKEKPIQFKKLWIEKLKLRKFIAPNIVYFQFNMSDPEIGFNSEPRRNERNKALRCAIRKAFNWQELIDSYLDGFGKPFPGMVPPQLEGYDPNISAHSITYDPQGAKGLLESFGWNAKNLPNLPFSGVASASLRRNFTLFRNWLENIGYPREKIILKEFKNFSEYRDSIQKRELRFIADFLWILDFPDAENILQLFYGPNESPGANSSNYKNHLFDELFVQIAAMQSSPKRNKLIGRANEILIEDCAVIAGMSEQHVHAWHNQLIIYPYSGVITNIFKYLGYETKLAKLAH